MVPTFAVPRARTFAGEIVGLPGAGGRRYGKGVFVGVILFEESRSSRGEAGRKGYIKRLKYMNYYIEV